MTKFYDLLGVFIIVFLFNMGWMRHATWFDAGANSFINGSLCVTGVAVYWGWRWFKSPTKSY